MLVNIAVAFEVPNPEEAASFLGDELEFETTRRADGALLCSNGAIAIAVTCGQGTRPTLELQTDDLATECERLLKVPGTTEAANSTDMSGNRRERVLDAACGLRLVLFQELDEDELGELVALPAALPWEPEADGLVRELLRLVPVWVRDGARRRVTEQAEYLAVESGRLDVSTHTALRAFVICTLPSRRAALYAELKGRGCDPTPYQKEAES